MTDSSWDFELTKPNPEAFPAAFEAFFIQHQPQFLKIARARLRDRLDAEDAVQEAAVKIHRKWERILAHPNPSAMAYRILQQTLIDFYRRQARIALREETARPDPPSAAYIMELGGHDLLDAALDELEKSAPVQASCVRLRYLAQLPYDDVARYMDISPGAAKTNVSLALDKLEDIMKNISDAGEGDS